ncbi:restriction endonuclease subunit S [Acinetobacter baumannii]|uniref:restriction endonuclease subunit S n=1 Tax=Acinetobacter baumannii TaxID=470 RepID=UPI003F641E0D
MCTTVSGGTPSTKVEAYWENGSIEWVTPTDITKLKSLILLNPEKKISQLGLEKSSAKLLPPNTILMTSRASIGYFGLIDKEVCTNQGFISIIPDREILRYYLLFNLKSRISEIDALASGATFKEISKSTFRSMPILIPSDKVLEAFDNVVRPIISQMRNLELQNDNLLKLKETLLPRLMSGELDVSKLSSIE